MGGFTEMKVHRRTDFFGRECSDSGVGGWVSCNPNVVQICKSVRNIGRSLNKINIHGITLIKSGLSLKVIGQRSRSPCLKA